MRVLICPLGSPGYSFPAIAIGHALLARGHEVVFVTAGWLAPLLRRQGLTFLPTPAQDVAFDTSRWHDAATVARQVQALNEAVGRLRPDVLVTSALALGPLIAGETAGLPVAVIGLLTELLPESGGRRVEFQAALDACRARVGLAPGVVARLRGDLYLRRGVPELIGVPEGIGVPQGIGVPEGIGVPHFIGACGWEPDAPRLVTDWMEAVGRGGGRIVYVHQARTFGAPGFWPMLADALPADVRIAVSTSRMDGSAAPVGGLAGPIIPQGAVLARAVAVVCSGTTGVVLGALAHGVPMVVVPAGGEQFEVAELLERAGVAVVVPARAATSARLAVALSQALALPPEPGERLRGAFAALDGATRASSLIEGLYSQYVPRCP